MTKKQTILRSTLSALFISAGVIQATHRELFTALVPRTFSEHGKQVQGIATGVLAGIGVSFLIPPLHQVARWSAIIMLSATLPAAIDQIRKPEQIKTLGIPPVAAALRIPLQVGVIIAAWIATQKTTTH